MSTKCKSPLQFLPRSRNESLNVVLVAEVEMEVLQQRGNPKLWSDKSKDATHSWVPRASTKALRCTEGDPTFAFRFATPLWSSMGQLQQNGRLNLVLPRSQRPPNPCPQAYSEAAQLVTYACTHDKRVQSQPKLCAQPVLNRQLATCTWDKNDRTSGIVYLCFYSYTLIAGNSATVLWVRGLKSIEIMAAFDEQLFSKQYPSECPQTPLSLRCKCLGRASLTLTKLDTLLTEFPCPMSWGLYWHRQL